MSGNLEKMPHLRMEAKLLEFFLLSNLEGLSLKMIHDKLLDEHPEVLIFLGVLEKPELREVLVNEVLPMVWLYLIDKKIIVLAADPEGIDVNTPVQQIKRQPLQAVLMLKVKKIVDEGHSTQSDNT
jgi:hypothetical protein